MAEKTNEVVDKQKKNETESWGSYLWDTASGIGINPPPYLGDEDGQNTITDLLQSGKQGLSEAGKYASNTAQSIGQSITNGSKYVVSNTVGAPQYDLRDDTPTTGADYIPDRFADKSSMRMSDSGIMMHNPVFDKAHMKQDLLDLQLQGAGSDMLEQAMIKLYDNPKGAELDEALASVKEARGLDLTIEELREQYATAMELKKAGEEHAKANGIEDEVSPSFKAEDLKPGGIHEGFTGSQTQLAFGTGISELVGIDPVFGSLVSPTGGAVGPGDESISDADYTNPAVLHGIKHDLAGYLYNAHGLGPGYNYTKAGLELPTSSPLSGQVSGMAYMADRNPLLNTLAIGGTFLKNIPWYGLSSDNFVQSGVEVGSGNGFSDAADATQDFIGGAWNGVKGLASDAWEGTKNVASNAWEGTKDMASNAWEGTKNVASGAWNSVKQGAQFVGDQANSLYQGAKGLAGDAWSGAKNLGSSAIDGIKGLGSSALQGGKSMLNGAKGLASDAIGGLQSIGSNALSGAKGLAGDAWSGMQSMGGKAKDGLSSLAGGAKNIASAGVDNLKTAGSNLLSAGSAVGEEIHSKWEDAKDFFSGGFSSLGW